MEGMAHLSYTGDLDEWKHDFFLYQEVKVRFSETDLFGHMNNTVPFVYFEQARILLFKKVGFIKNLKRTAETTIPVVADLQCDFFSQVYFDESLKIYVKVKKVGNSSADLHYMGTREDGSICFTGRSAIVQIHKETGKSLPWDNDIRQKLLSYQVPATRQ